MTTPIDELAGTPLTAEEQVIREWVEAMTTASGAPLPPSRRRAEPLPRHRVLPVVVTLLNIIDELRQGSTGPGRSATDAVRHQGRVPTRCCTEYESGPCPHGWVIEVANPVRGGPHSRNIADADLKPDATEEAGPTLTLADQHPGLRSGDLHHGLRHDDGDPDA